MRTTKQLSKALTLIQTEATERIKSFFNGKPYTRIVVDASRHLTIRTGMNLATVTEIHKNGDIYYSVFQPGSTKKMNILNRAVDCDPLPADALLTILDELARMKKENLLKK